MAKARFDGAWIIIAGTFFAFAARGIGIHYRGWKHMVEYQILYWKHVPSQVKVFEEGKRPISRQMPPSFQAEITRTAMALGITGTDDYLSQWQWTPRQKREGSAEEVAYALVRELQQGAGDTNKA